MSDSGTLAAVQAEIIAALSSPAIQAGMPNLPALSLEDLINKQALRTPAMGIIYLGTTNAMVYAIGSRMLRATTKWRVAISNSNMRGTQDARQDTYALLEKVRDQLHFSRSAQSPKALLLFQEEQCPDNQPEGKIVAYQDFYLDLILGK